MVNIPFGKLTKRDVFYFSPTPFINKVYSLYIKGLQIFNINSRPFIKHIPNKLFSLLIVFIWVI